MRGSLLVLLLALTAASTQAAQTLTRDGLTAPGIVGPPSGDRPVGLVNDGSFEFGQCDWGSAWTCTTNAPACGWILDPSGIWGYPAYDGELVAWLGGFCNDLPNSNSFCQDLISPDPYWHAWQLDWAFMGYVNGACSTLRITVDGEEAWRYTMREWDHTYGTWGYSSQLDGEVVIFTYGESFRLCFEWEACPDGVDNDNMLIDYVTLYYSIWDGDDDDVATAASSFSVVKSLY